jgi:hypothetical protein
MKKLAVTAIVLCLVSSCFAQLTQEQKVTGFPALAALYGKNYGPYEMSAIKKPAGAFRFAIKLEKSTVVRNGTDFARGQDFGEPS